MATVRTTLAIANIHCPSCISSIESILSCYSLPSQSSPSTRRNSFEKVVDALNVGGAAPELVRTRSPDATSTTPLHLQDVEADHFQPAFTDVNVSLLAGTVTFTHSPRHTLAPVIEELEEAGFEVIRAPETLDRGSTRGRQLRAHPHSSKWRWLGFGELFASPKAVERKEQAHRDNCAACREQEDAEERSRQRIPGKGKHREGHAVATANDDDRPSNAPLTEAVFAVDGMTCSSCTSGIEAALSPARNNGIHSVAVTLAYNSATVVFDSTVTTLEQIKEAIEDLGYDAAVSSSRALAANDPHGPTGNGQNDTRNHPDDIDGPFRATLSIGGMTCASCVSAVGNALEGIDGLLDYSVDLMGSSASIKVTAVTVVGRVRDEIEDAGYDCAILAVDEVKPSRGPKAEQPSRGEESKRTVEVTISGFFCEHCPAKANAALLDLSKRFDIVYTPSTLDNPASSITYTPSPTSLTLRTIRSAMTELGFALDVVKTETLQDRARQAQKDERRRLLIRLVICIIFCIPTFIIGVVAASLLPMHNRFRMYWEEPVWGSATRMTIALFALATPVQFGVGEFFYTRSYKSLRAVWRKRRGGRASGISQRRIWLDRLFRWGSMDSLVALGTSIAWLSSFAYMLLDITTPGMSEMAYFDTSVFLITFILAGRYLESLSKQKTGDALLELGRLRPKQGLLYDEKEGKVVEEVDSAFIEIGDCLLVPVGASPPVDCALAESSSLISFDEASLTGESRPVAKKPGDSIYAGTHNSGPGAAIVVVQRRDGETVLDSIVTGVRNAMSKKASIERLADAITAVFVPAIVGVACLTFVVWIIRGYSGDLPPEWLRDQKGGGWVLFAIQFSVAVLVVACPCGIGLAAPTAQLVGVGLAARHGIMPNGGGEAFQAFSTVDAICFDKTGTITKGRFQVSDHRVIAPSGTRKQQSSLSLTENEIWQVLGAVEQASSHPIALAVQAFTKERLSHAENAGHRTLRLRETTEIPGRGMLTTIQRDEGPSSFPIFVGNAKLLEENGIALSSEHQSTLSHWSNQGQSIVLVANGETLLAALAVSDPLRDETRYVLDALRNDGVEVYIVSGDSASTVSAVARTLNITEDHLVGGALPEDKREFVERLQGQQKSVRTWRTLGRQMTRRKIVAFVGDGINDSIALSQADVSIAQGGGSAVATSTAHFALLNDSLLSILTLQSISRATYRRIVSNFCWASVYNVVLIPLAAGAFYDLGKTKLPAVWASLAMALSSVSVVVNSLLLRWTFRQPKSVRRFYDQA